MEDSSLLKVGQEESLSFRTEEPYSFYLLADNRYSLSLSLLPSFTFYLSIHLYGKEGKKKLRERGRKEGRQAGRKEGRKEGKKEEKVD